MKRTLITIFSILFCAITFAQSVPQGINYQAVARDSTGAVLMNQNLTIQFGMNMVRYLVNYIDGDGTPTLGITEENTFINDKEYYIGYSN